MTQQERIINYLNKFGSITSMQAFSDLGITRISARIFDLRKDGYDIESEQTKGLNRFGEEIYYTTYRLKDKDGKTKELNS